MRSTAPSSNPRSWANSDPGEVLLGIRLRCRLSCQGCDDRSFDALPGFFQEPGFGQSPEQLPQRRVEKGGGGLGKQGYALALGRGKDCAGLRSPATLRIRILIHTY